MVTNRVIHRYLMINTRHKRHIFAELYFCESSKCSIRPVMVGSASHGRQREIRPYKQSRKSDAADSPVLVHSSRSRDQIGEPLPAKCEDHPLSGKWNGRRDCHIESDWILIYFVRKDDLILERTGSHSDLF